MGMNPHDFGQRVDALCDALDEVLTPEGKLSEPQIDALVSGFVRNGATSWPALLKMLRRHPSLNRNSAGDILADSTARLKNRGVLHIGEECGARRYTYTGFQR